MRNTSLILLLGLALCACTDTTAAARVTYAGTQTLSAVQLDQYRRDARATQSAQDATVEAQAYRLASTASVATQTQIAVTQRAVAQATAAVYTQQAVGTVAARDATLQAGQDADATATAQAQIHADSVATLQRAQQSTATAVVVGTKTAIELRQLDADATRTQISSWGLAVIAALAALVLLLVVFGLGLAIIRRLQVVYYGLHRNPLVVLPGGVIYNPLTGITSGEELPPELAAELAVMGQQVLALQAAHSPHAPAVATRTALKIGPVATSSESAPVTVGLPALPATATAALPEPKVEVQKLFIKTDHNSKAVREQQDIVEFIDDGWGARGLARSAWVGRLMTTTGNKIGRGYYDLTMKTFEQLGLIEKTGDGWKPIVSREEALDAFGLAHAD